MPTLKEILANTEDFPDDAVITLKDGVQVKAADLRAYAQQENAATIAAIQERQQQLADLEARITEQAENVARYQAELEQRRGAEQGQKTFLEQLADLAKGPNKKTMLDLADDEFFGPGVKKLNEFETARKEAADQLKALREEATKVISWLTQREVDRDFNSLPDRPKELTKQKLIEHAMKRGYKDDLGYPDLRRAYDDVTAPIRAKAEREKTRAEIKAEIEREQREARAKAPTTAEDAAATGGHVFVPNGSGKSGAGAPKKRGGYGGIDRVPTEVILNDPDVAALLNQ